MAASRRMSPMLPVETLCWVLRSIAGDCLFHPPIET